MVLSLVAFACLSSGFRGAQQEVHPGVILLDAATGKETGYVEQRAEPLTVHPQYSPKLFAGQRWRFDWETVAFEKLIPGNKSFSRFFVFSQERKDSNDTALAVGRMLERLWEYNYTHYNFDHVDVFGHGVDYVYLCKGGEPGGEQRFEEDAVNGTRPQKVCTMYFYDLATFKDPVEMAREVAHEYGHASLPGVEGYSDPEDWANGFLGEKLYLKHIDELMARKLLDPEDAMGISKEKLDDWVAKNVTPLVTRGAAAGPNLALLKARDKTGMDNYIGSVLFAESILPDSVFARSLVLMPSSSAEDYPDAVLEAVQEAKPFRLKMPSFLIGKPMWVPLGLGQLKGAPILERKQKWVKILGQAAPVEITPIPDPNP
jgi:hypothetical protein